MLSTMLTVALMSGGASPVVNGTDAVSQPETIWATAALAVFAFLRGGMQAHTAHQARTFGGTLNPNTSGGMKTNTLQWSHFSCANLTFDTH